MNLPQISGLKLLKIFHKAGFEIIRRKGSHVRLEKKTDEKIIKLTIPMYDRLKKGTLSRILKDSKLTEEEFENLL